MLNHDLARGITSGGQRALKAPLQIHFYSLAGVIRAMYFLQASERCTHGIQHRRWQPEVHVRRPGLHLTKLGIN
ncbi:MAG: hypothetical protein ETSY2_08535 [Candidatus Entotheonella gemina]|uniref:Uncharacterized protein n=1 Tax=Candidatus Entotheonella gemina TaxID=1429439 RepID=W4MC30_9BACT|nr:MAG: hypothetical protein ETSY2_08535 [Candidatus Entotheonella gemina]